jgi:hypothetical protein
MQQPSIQKQGDTIIRKLKRTSKPLLDQKEQRKKPTETSDDEDSKIKSIDIFLKQKKQVIHPSSIIFPSSTDSIIIFS